MPKAPLPTKPNRGKYLYDYIDYDDGIHCQALLDSPTEVPFWLLPEIAVASFVKELYEIGYSFRQLERQLSRWLEMQILPVVALTMASPAVAPAVPPPAVAPAVPPPAVAPAVPPPAVAPAPAPITVCRRGCGKSFYFAEAKEKHEKNRTYVKTAKHEAER